MNIKSMKMKKGFTLIELIIVIIIMGILAAIVIPQYIGMKSMAIQTRMHTLAGTMMSTANLTNSMSISLGFSQGATGDLLVVGDGLAKYGFPKTDAICGLIRLTDMPAVTCVNGVATASDAATPTACKITYVEAISSAAGPTVDISALDVTNC